MRRRKQSRKQPKLERTLRQIEPTVAPAESREVKLTIAPLPSFELTSQLSPLPSLSLLFPMSSSTHPRPSASPANPAKRPRNRARGGKAAGGSAHPVSQVAAQDVSGASTPPRAFFSIEGGSLSSVQNNTTSQ